MARDIHDTLAQGFMGVIVQLEAAADARSRGMSRESEEHCERAASLARESLHEARRSVLALRPPILDESNLCEALKTLFGKMTASTALTSEFRIHGQPVTLPPGWEEGLLRIAQESLNNTLRHAQATRFSADLSFDQDELRLELHDNGRGFDERTQHSGFGLLGIRERAKEMGGTVTIKSTNLEGTTISVQVPLTSGEMDRF
jgi:signal transduction histidine kinase